MSEKAAVDVLIIEDYADSRELLGLTLRRRGYSVLLAATAAEALELLTTYQPGLLLIDVGLPDMAGDQLARTIRETPEISGATLVALTGSHASSGAGFDVFDGVRYKPIAPSVLVKLVEQVRAGQKPDQGEP